MNYHQRHLPPGANRALPLVSLLLFAASTSCDAIAMPRIFHAKAVVVAPSSSHGYLVGADAPALRFQEAIVLPEAPHSKSSTSLSSALPVPAPANAPESTRPTATIASAPVAAEPAPQETQAEKTTSSKNKPSPVIIPDDTRSTVRPEDFLPFFQFPATGKETGALNVLVPVPRDPSNLPALPASSATYTQTPK